MALHQNTDSDPGNVVIQACIDGWTLPIRWRFGANGHSAWRRPVRPGRGRHRRLRPRRPAAGDRVRRPRRPGGHLRRERGGRRDGQRRRAAVRRARRRRRCSSAWSPTGRSGLRPTRPIVGTAEHVVVVIGTPVDEHLNPDQTAIPKALGGCAAYLRDGQLLVLRRTVYPGVTALVEKMIAGLGVDDRRGLLPRADRRGQGDDRAVRAAADRLGPDAAGPGAGARSSSAC